MYVQCVTWSSEKTLCSREVHQVLVVQTVALKSVRNAGDMVTEYSLPGALGFDVILLF